jgi:tetratricopeptide (TPR) repeat protein
MTRRKRPHGREGDKRSPAQRPSLAKDRRRRLWILLGAAAVAAAAFFVLARFFPTGGPRIALSRAEDEAGRSHPLRAEALDLAEQVVRDYPHDANALLARGMVLYRLALYAPAIESWRACLELDPRAALAHACLGRYAFENGDYDKTLELMRQALKLDPSTPDALLYIGKAQVHRGELEEAAGAFRK